MFRPGLPKLIATDLDGTLVRSDDTVSEFTRSTLAQAHAAGITIVGATGRGPRLLSMVRRDIPSADYLVLAGGSRVVSVSHPGEPVVLEDRRLDGAVLAEVLATIEAEVGTLSVMIEADDGENAPLWGDRDPTWRYPDLVEARIRSESLHGPVIKGFARHLHHDADALLAVACRLIPPDVATITQTGLGYIEVCPPGVDKASGLDVVAAATGIDPDTVLAFGDMPNDIPMLQWAGFGRVAVANAHPAVLAIADTTTLTNDEDGVAVYLRRLLDA